MKQVNSSSESLSEGTKGLLSLLVILHLACVLAAVAANFRRSLLLAELTRIFAPYTQGLGLDPGQAPYFLTHGDVPDDDAVFIVDLYGSGDMPLDGQQPLASVTLPDHQSRWLNSRRRYLTLARQVQINTPPEGEPGEYEGEVIIAVAKGVGRALLEEHQARRAVVRCVRRMSQPRDLAALDPGFPPDNPRDAAYDVTILTADVWIDVDGQTQAARRVPRSEQAPLRTEGPR